MIDSLLNGARRCLAIAPLLAALAFCPPAAEARGVLQCVPYARSVSGIEIRGNAHTWWQQAAGVYERGQRPRVGAVLAFRSSSAMPLGHVAVVGRIVDERRVLLNHANWSRPGMIERSALAEDVSAAGDWSRVRVWYAPSGTLGQRENATYGFIYPDKGPGDIPQVDARPIQLASRADEAGPAGLPGTRTP